ncbi:MAG: biotin synthase, partial [Acidobacteriota bacterium]
GLLRELSNLNPHPESVPVNLLVPVEGTPLGDRPAEDPLELVRMIATARIMMPKSMVRLSAGRLSLTDEAQALCFLAGANSVFLGEKLLTTANPEADTDQALFAKLGVTLQTAHAGD